MPAWGCANLEALETGVGLVDSHVGLTLLDLQDVELGSRQVLPSRDHLVGVASARIGQLLVDLGLDNLVAGEDPVVLLLVAAREVELEICDLEATAVLLELQVALRLGLLRPQASAVEVGLRLLEAQLELLAIEAGDELALLDQGPFVGDPGETDTGVDGRRHRDLGRLARLERALGGNPVHEARALDPEERLRGLGSTAGETGADQEHDRNRRWFHRSLPSLPARPSTRSPAARPETTSTQS